MRFKKGDKVEVMNIKEVPVSWHVVKILSGNGHTYHVEHDSYPGMASEQKVETVSRKLVRPCPLLVQGVESCIAGDIVEVFNEYSWKSATIVKVLEGKKVNKSNKIQNQYLVRLLGCSEELIIDQSNIRMRQTWHNDEWILMGKSSQGSEDVIVSKPLPSKCNQKMNSKIPQLNARARHQPQKDYKNIEDDAAFWDPRMIPSRSLKRMSPYHSSIVEAHNGHHQKLRAVEKDGKMQRVVVTPVLEKVDAVSYPRETLGEKNMHASFKIISNGYNKMEGTKLSNILRYSEVRSSSSDSDECSVGSCSVTSQSPNQCYSPSIALPCQEIYTLCSDAESSSVTERKSSSLPPKVEVEVSIRRLEMHAYRSTLEALYAAGPLSWEQESLLTNLRIVLHISNDEHLMELKHLISAKTAINV
ncbi:hypothetical protein ACJIZ3_004979 [Penstemon smallii]|uniref:ENT domain-containing protein n=1 Tax=Penstemon smallii TaxID=265156 RepID=A0ABD3S3L4_9LAMI